MKNYLKRWLQIVKYDVLDTSAYYYYLMTEPYSDADYEDFWDNLTFKQPHIFSGYYLF